MFNLNSNQIIIQRTVTTQNAVMIFKTKDIQNGFHVEGIYGKVCGIILPTNNHLLIRNTRTYNLFVQCSNNVGHLSGFNN